MRLIHVQRVITPRGRKSYRDLEDLYRDQWAEMVRLAWLMNGSREAAEDIVHDAFLRLEPLWPSLQHPAAYLRQVVVNGVRTYQRRVAMERRHRPIPLAPSTTDCEFQNIWAVVDDLPTRQREALILRFYLDLTISDVAELLGCPVGTTKSLIHRGLATVREKVEE